MNKEEIIKNFNPSSPGLANATIFGLPFNEKQSEIVIIPVPWEVTVSYGSGAAKGPNAILDASYQVDLLHEEYPELWKLGIFFGENPKKPQKKSKKYRELAKPLIKALENGLDINSDKLLKNTLQEINDACATMVEQVKEKTLHWLYENKLPVLLGGDHSTPLGYYQAIATKYSAFGILHIDAHLDLRIAYEGFTFSHASVMYNSLQIPQVSKIVSVGIRDFCEEELMVCATHKNKISVFTNSKLKSEQFEGKTWQQQCDEIINSLPENVCISFDIDGLNALYCPNTGTPVPGGFSYEHATYLITKLAESNKKIIGIDLVEVAPGKDDWDGNVGARLLFHLCGAFAKSKGLNVGKKILF